MELLLLVMSVLLLLILVLVFVLLSLLLLSEVGVALPSGKVGKAGVGTAVTEDMNRVPVRIETSSGLTVALGVEELARDAGFSLRMSQFVGRGDCGRERGRTGAFSCTLEDRPDRECLWDAIERDVVVGAGAW